MKNHLMLKSAVLASISGLVFLAALGDAKADPFPQHASAVPMSGVAVGESVKIDDGLELTFVAVRQDTRRPVGNTTAKAGDAIIVMRAKMNNQPVRTYKMSLKQNSGVFIFPHRKKNKDGEWVNQRYFVNLDRLAPRPVEGKKIKQSEYRLEFYAGLDRIIHLW